MKFTSVRSQDQRRMSQANSHTFPTNVWFHKITKKKESDRYDLCKTLWITEGRFKTEKDLPDGIVVLLPVGNKAGVFCILEHKSMSDVCDRYLTRVKLTDENQYTSLRRVISDVIQCQDWKVEQIRFITGAHSVNK